MTRQEALDILKKHIPSFNLKYIHWEKEVDKEKDKSWLYKDELYSQLDGERKNFFLPEFIPVDFLVGTEATDRDGEEFVAVADLDNGRRRVDLSVTDFAYYGNNHKYGKLRVDGLKWKSKKHSYSTISRELNNIEPRVRGIWDIDLCKILTAEDIGRDREDWESYEAGEATCRFSDISELYCTAAYVALLRIGGDFDLTVDSYTSACPKESDYLLKLKDGDVVFCGLLHYAMSKI